MLTWPTITDDSIPIELQAVFKAPVHSHWLSMVKMKCNNTQKKKKKHFYPHLIPGCRVLCTHTHWSCKVLAQEIVSLNSDHECHSRLWRWPVTHLDAQMTNHCHHMSPLAFLALWCQQNTRFFTAEHLWEWAVSRISQTQVTGHHVASNSTTTRGSGWKNCKALQE